MTSNTKIINRLDSLCTSNEMVGAALSVKGLSLDRQLRLIENVTLFKDPTGTINAVSGKEVPLLVPRGYEFVCLTSLDTNPQDRHSLLFETDTNVLPMILPGLPAPVSQVNIEEMWKDKLYGAVLDPNKVYYLCEPGVTTLIQRVSWRVLGGRPMLLGETSITLFKWVPGTMTDDSFQGYLHELLERPPWILTHQSRPELIGQAAQPDQETPS